MAGTKRMSSKWKERTTKAEAALTRAGAQAVVDSGGKVSVTDAFMKQFAIVKMAEMIGRGEITSADILAARKEEVGGGLPVPV
jgi:hypothetical protein